MTSLTLSQCRIERFQGEEKTTLQFNFIDLLLPLISSHGEQVEEECFRDP